MIVVDGESLSEVEEWAKTDPYNSVSLFASVEVFPLKNIVYEGNLQI